MADPAIAVVRLGNTEVIPIAAVAAATVLVSRRRG
jgi:hypothetical protein